MDEDAAIFVIAKAMASHPSLSELYSDNPADYIGGHHLYNDPHLVFIETGEAEWVLTALLNAGYKVVKA